MSIDELHQDWHSWPDLPTLNQLIDLKAWNDHRQESIERKDSQIFVL